MTLLRNLTAAVLLTAVLGCAGVPEGSYAPPTEAILVQAAALGHVFDNNDSSVGSSADSYCVGIGAAGLNQTPPPPSLLRELRARFPDVVPLSQCDRANSAGGGWRVVDELSRLASIAFLIDEPSFEGEGRARVYAEYVESDRFATGYDCRLARGAEGWTVERCDSGFPR